MEKYVIYKREDSGTTVVCEITDGVFSGPSRLSIEAFLIAEGYPEKPPDRILYGQRMWAARIGNRPTTLSG